MGMIVITKADKRFSKDKEDNYLDTIESRDHPNAYISSGLKTKVNEKYSKEIKERFHKKFSIKNTKSKIFNFHEQVRLVDYISEFSLNYLKTDKSCIDLIIYSLTERIYNGFFYNEKYYIGSYGLQSFNMEDFINSVFINHSSTPEELVENLIGKDNWNLIQNRIKKRSDKEKNEIEDNITKELKKPSYLELAILRYSPVVKIE